MTDAEKLKYYRSLYASGTVGDGMVQDIIAIAERRGREHKSLLDSMTVAINSLTAQLRETEADRDELLSYALGRVE